ncbi:MAG: PAS domain S-box protein [Desulfobacterales bacterium]|nr:PAS domain S-box protein [Desulfobacterales bacterium]
MENTSYKIRIPKTERPIGHLPTAKRVEKPTYKQLEAKIKKLEADIEQRIQTEKDLQALGEKHKLIFEKASEAIFIIQDGVIKFANRRTRGVLGYTNEELKTLLISEIVHPEDRERVVSRHVKKLKGQKAAGIHSFRILSKTGKEIWIEDTTVRVIWEGKPATLNFVRNITKKKKLDAQLQFAAKLEAIGTLAGGIAHAFNNLMMGIQGHTSLLLYDIDSTHPHYESLKKIEKEIQDGAELTSQLIGYARKGRYRAGLINMNEIVENTSKTFGKMKREILIHRELTQRPYDIEADQGQMEQMLLNLYINAADAMAGGGDLILQTQNVIHTDIKSKLYQPVPGKYVRIKISDKGVGMDKQIQQRIFDPFFTTKRTGWGTGLGLASVYGIVKSHEGYVNVESKKGQGTTFYIYLPAAQKKK